MSQQDSGRGRKDQPSRTPSTRKPSQDREHSSHETDRGEERGRSPTTGRFIRDTSRDSSRDQDDRAQRKSGE